jgi:hypothetical protein
MSRTRGLLLAVMVTFGALGAMPAQAELKNVFVGPGRYMEGTMSKLGVTTSLIGYVDTGVEAGFVGGEPYAGPLVEALWGVVTVRKGTVQKAREGLYTVSIDPALSLATISGTIDGVSINVTMMATGDPTPAAYSPNPDAIAPPDFVFAAAGLDVTRTASLAGSASATGIGGITGGSGSGKIGAIAAAYIYYA